MITADVSSCLNGLPDIARCEPMAADLIELQAMKDGHALASLNSYLDVAAQKEDEPASEAGFQCLPLF